MDNRHFGYDAASGLLCEIEDEDAGFLSGENSPVISPVMKKAQARCVFSFKEMERCTVALDAIPEIVTHHIEHIFPRKLILEVTENCNLRCKYCFNTIGNGQRIHAKKQMTAETAFAGIDHYFKVYREKCSLLFKIIPRRTLMLTVSSNDRCLYSFFNFFSVPGSILNSSRTSVGSKYFSDWK